MNTKKIPWTPQRGQRIEAVIKTPLNYTKGIMESNLKGSVEPEDLAWQAAGGADENERLKAQIRQLRQQLAEVPALTERPRVASWTYQGLAVLLVAVVWLLFFSGYELWDELHLDLSNKLIVDFGAEVVWKVAELFLIPLALALVGAVKVALGRDRAGGLKGWL